MIAGRVITFGTLFEKLWNLLSSRQAMALYFLILFACITAMVIAVLVMISIGNGDQKGSKKNGTAPKKPVAPVKDVTKSAFMQLADDEEDITSRFHTLVQLDRASERYVAPKYDDTLTLADICRNFRNFAANERGLFYCEEDVRKFIAGLGVAKICVMQGLSGTGKTSMATAFGDYLANPSTVISVQPMWKERSDMVGYFNEFTKRFSEGTILKKLYEARYTDEIYVIVLDEMNIARVEYYFADFLSQMELNPSSRYLEVVSDTWDDDPKLLERGMLRIPENVWFIGTANNDDSTFAISDKVYDRAMVMNLDRKAEIFTPDPAESDRLSYTHFSELITAAKRENQLSQETQEKIRKVDEFLTERFRITYGNRIRRQMEEYIPLYIACGGSEIAAVDDLLAKKVLRKLDSLSPVMIRYSIDDLKNVFESTFGLDAMPSCKESLERLRRNASA
ncbi:MAG: hypothetical protein IJM57_04260 [Lachnospiraceae bacterium]|nr:hypothetical protein [Lachnospiraceae bacterium]